ncbi:MAG: enoyl-CoA hydratase-related protein [Alphaproteobacteria bacterium]
MPLLTLNRPAKRNAIDEVMLASLAEKLETLKGADHVRIVFLRGAGQVFCAGADIEMMRRQGGHSMHDNEEDALALSHALKALHDLPQFTVALVQKGAIGVGGGLVAACDYAVATEDAQFRFPEARLGILPAMVAPYVIEAIGTRAARALFASALPVDAARAKALGLIQEIVADELGLESALKHLAGLAFENAPSAVAAAKQLVRDVAGRQIDDRLVKETAKRSAVQRASEEGQEGTTAFLEKRRPAWDRGAGVKSFSVGRRSHRQALRRRRQRRGPRRMAEGAGQAREGGGNKPKPVCGTRAWPSVATTCLPADRFIG